MDDILWNRDEIDSPCVKICVVHPDANICIGCYRTIDEIARWSKMSADDRRVLMAELPGRAPQLRKRRGGRAAKVGTNGS